MSLDISLIENHVEVWSSNITHNLTELADKAGLYHILWNTHGELSVLVAKYAKPILIEGLCKLLTMTEEEYIPYLPKNGWGDFNNLSELVLDYIHNCTKYPNAIIEIYK